MIGNKQKNVMDLSRILEYNMNEIESKAYKCALIWTTVCKKMFPKEQFAKLRKSGDPRKSYLFKCCYKLVSETSGIIPDDEYKLYIYSQCDMLRGITNGEVHARIDPTCLFGEKAWWRWRIWKKKYDNQSNYKSAEEPIVASPKVILKELKKDKDFLTSVFSHFPSKNELLLAESNKTLFKWLHFGKISPYFVVTHPDLNEDGYGIDMGIYKNHITPEIEEWFIDNMKDSNG